MPGTNGQSALHPAGSGAQWIMDLTWVMTIGATIIFIIVMLLVWMAVKGPAGLRGVLASRAMIMAGGVAFPVVVLTALLAWGLAIARDIRVSAQEPAVRIEVSGEQWWWRITYLDSAQRPLFATGNEIHLPAGSEAAFSLVSPDVIHSFWIPVLGGKMDAIPGRETRLQLTPTEPGRYRGVCAEFCGASHALMAFDVIVHEPEAFDAWLAAEARDAEADATPLARAGCTACHTIRGVTETGRIGPDLTHLAARERIAAGVLPNTEENLRRWISNPQAIKPGALMPPYGALPMAELDAIVDLLGSLE
ncbi:MAG TPA: cytochrome c oxidase subunit II [Rhizobiaceae bacterium]|nr:cytochrome c oxidase subunit II [Rhizobiaceae bacterium]